MLSRLAKTFTVESPLKSTLLLENISIDVWDVLVDCDSFACERCHLSSINNKSIGAVAALKNWKTTSFRKCSGCWGRAPSGILHQLGRRWPAGIGSWRCWRRRSSASPTASSAAWTSRGRWLRSGAPAPGSGTTPLKHVSIWEVQRVEVIRKGMLGFEYSNK